MEFTHAINHVVIPYVYVDLVVSLIAKRMSSSR